MSAPAEPVGSLVRRWRQRRRRAQLDVALAAGVSTRHLSFIETGRANPSRVMVERLCEELDVPLRERNAFYLGAGFAPCHPEHPLTDLGAASEAVQTVLAGLEPNPALVVNVRWELLAANRAMGAFFAGVSAELTEPPVNVLRATLHPDGLAPRIRNLAQWRAHVLRRVRRALERTAAPGLAELLHELEGYPATNGADGRQAGEGEVAIPMRLSAEHGELALLYTTTVFGSPRDVTLDEIAVETFFPADAASAAALRHMAAPAVL